ncbi:MAG TPA: type II toxin-antitoxin system VapC family toxin [Acetobacteraceae bacterium]|jgi:PIN domain nuclease of toxin-antitoxin system|nr:type II toxin-antitoxin system VapC family toxin [Acetobacteraceae bacterium]
MRLLLDTHALVWWWTDDARLPVAARAAIAEPDNTVLVSAASGWELATKHRLGKWLGVQRLLDDFDGALRRSRFGVLAISLAHAFAAGALEGPHRDPFDRMLIAQCRAEGMPIVSGDPVFAQYRAQVIWRS